MDCLKIEHQKFEPHHQKINGTLAEAIRAYESRGVPLRQLLTDYNDVITEPYELMNAVNPWQHIKHEKGEAVVCGVSTAEALFNISAMSLHKLSPVTVIKSVYYRNQERNDSALEKVFLGSLMGNISSDQRVMIINPSPIVVELVERIRKNMVYAVIDQTMASLYSKQFKHSRFVSIDEIYSIIEVDTLIVFTTNTEESSLQQILEYIGTIRTERIYGIVQTRLLDNKESLLWKALSRGRYAIRSIVIVPNEASNSKPKKKCLVSFEGETDNESIDDALVAERELIIQKLEYDSSEKMVFLSDQRMTIRQDDLMRCRTINQLWKRAFAEDTREEKKIKRKTEIDYTSATLYTYSREIQISYAIYHDNNGYYAKAYYASTKNVHLPAIRGKALTARVERGLRAKTVDQVIDALEKVPYSKTMFEAITADIKTHYLNAGEQVTLKTLWFCLRNELQKNPSYDDDTMAVLFSRGNAISDLYPDRDKGDAFKQAIEEQIKDEEEVKELRLLKMVNLVISEAIKRGYLSENRILPLIPPVQSRATKRQSEARQALAKRSFEQAEEQKILNYLFPLCVKSSIYLAVVIRLMTGISIREVCGLLWSDFRYDAKIGIFTISVTKFVDSNGKIIHHVLEENWIKYRVLPISILLGRILQARKDYLKKEGLDDQMLEEYPIILPRENIDHMRKGYKPIHCKPAAVAEKCRKSIEAAEIPQFLIVLPDRNGNDIETDINSYNGDIFKTNFRDKALNVAGFELDELHHYLGLKKPDTFSNHYCDYNTNPYIQLTMAQKLDRWTAYYDSGKQADKKRNSTAGIIRGIGDGVSYVEIEVNRSSVCNGPIIICIESMHGFKILVSSYFSEE